MPAISCQTGCTALHRSYGMQLRVAVHDAVLYTTELRAPKLEGPAVRLLTWNVASLRSTLKKVSTLHAVLASLTASL